jgi:hypothetical protein
MRKEREELFKRLAEIQRQSDKIIEEAIGCGLGINRSTWQITDPKDWEANLPADYPAEDI